MSRRTPIAPITLPSASRRAEAFKLVGITSPVAARGLRRAFLVTPRSTTSRRAAVNSRVSSSLMKRESDCSTTSSCRKPSSSETASFACRIFPSRSETNTGSGAFLMMMSAAIAPRAAPFSVALVPSCRPLAGDFGTFLATAFLQVWAMPGGRGAHCAEKPLRRQDQIPANADPGRKRLAAGCFLFGGARGRGDHLEPLVRDRLSAFDRERVRPGREACLGALYGLELPAQIV